MIRESDRIKNKLLALNLRLAELRMEMERTQIRVIQLETQMEDSQLAALFGEGNGTAGALAPQLDQTRSELDRQKAMIQHVRNSQRDTHLRYLIERRREAVEAGSVAQAATEAPARDPVADAAEGPPN
jgi:hypothetical protein